MKNKENKNIAVRLISNIYVKNILLMVIVFVVLVALVLFSLNIYTQHDKTVTVPSVKGLQSEEAGGILSSAGLNYEISDSIFQQGGTPGAVLEQVPKEQSIVKQNRTVYLIIQAKGEQMVPVPELKDFSRRQAEAQLNSLGFSNLIIEEVSSPYAGIVISVSYKGQELKPNQKVPKGSTLKMVVGAGGESLDDSIETPNRIENPFFE